ncbi:hypothetical protein KY347_01400 [Candidatus Woesearchaeota archaeon]|nr:hypothetical protein [Candidatus Woesearchaeota archaeon]
MMLLSRRDFTKGFVPFILSLDGFMMGYYAILNDEDMKPAPVFEGKVLCDLHAHPSNEVSNKIDLEAVIRMLGSPGLIGLAAKEKNWNILTYEEAKNLVEDDPSFKEITPGNLAAFRDGYFARVQEIMSVGIHDILAIGWDGDYFHSSYDNIEDVVEAIHERNGLAILCHPFSIRDGSFIRLPSKEERVLIQKACTIVDEVEVHNAQNIDLVPVFASMKEANKIALISRKH